MRVFAVFCAAYSFLDAVPEELIAPSVMTVEEITSRFGDRKVIYTGDGMLMHKDEIVRDNAVLAPANLSEVRAGSAAALAAIKAADGGAGDLEDIIPLYLRKSQAERLYKPKQEDQK